MNAPFPMPKPQTPQGAAPSVPAAAHISRTPAPLRRPAVLIRAARAGLPLYRRARDLRRLLGAEDTPPAPGRALLALLELETECEARRHDDPGYDASRHLTVLIALLAEARLCPPTQAPATLHAIPAARRAAA